MPLRYGFFPENALSDGPASWIFQDSPIREKFVSNQFLSPLFLLGISYYCVYRLFLWFKKIFRRESRDYLSYILRANIC